FLWAIGYYSEEQYAIHQINVRGRGTLRNVVLRHINGFVQEKGSWAWNSNPFLGTTEAQALQVFLILTNDWQPSDAFNRIIYDPESRDTIYYVSTIAAAFGKANRRLDRSSVDVMKYANEPVLDAINGDTLLFHYKGENRSVSREFPVKTVKWLVDLLSQLSSAQISAAVKAGGFEDVTAKALAKALEERFALLHEAVSKR
ncbi:MAG: hypothetical protein M3N41_07845, partial [Acidobacteriota bacterium]|nr:hypothetical protein [Acidobacteriota bacterium]